MNPTPPPTPTSSTLDSESSHAGGHATVAMVAFAETATVVLPPCRWPNQVLHMDSGGGTTAFCDAVKLADALLDLRGPRTLRLLAVVSDGDLADPDPAQRLITTLHRSGCPVLWLRPLGHGHTFADATTVTVTDPVQAIDYIAAAAVTAIQAACPTTAAATPRTEPPGQMPAPYRSRPPCHQLTGPGCLPPAGTPPRAPHDCPW
jgi:hypothetical protein